MCACPKLCVFFFSVGCRASLFFPSSCSGIRRYVAHGLFLLQNNYNISSFGALLKAKWNVRAHTARKIVARNTQTLTHIPNWNGKQFMRFVKCLCVRDLFRFINGIFYFMCCFLPRVTFVYTAIAHRWHIFTEDSNYASAISTAAHNKSRLGNWRTAKRCDSKEMISNEQELFFFLCMACIKKCVVLADARIYSTQMNEWTITSFSGTF